MSCFLLQLLAQGLVLEGQHTAIGVIDDDELLRAQQVVRNNERPQGIFCRDPTRVADNVRLASLQSTKLSTVSRASIQARIASLRDGGIERWPSLKSRA